MILAQTWLTEAGTCSGVFYRRKYWNLLHIFGQILVLPFIYLWQDLTLVINSLIQFSQFRGRFQGILGFQMVMLMDPDYLQAGYLKDPTCKAPGYSLFLGTVHNGVLGDSCQVLTKQIFSLFIGLSFEDAIVTKTLQFFNMLLTCLINIIINSEKTIARF